MTQGKAENQSTTSMAAILFAVFAVVCLVAFFAYRAPDVGRLGQLVGNLGGGPLFGDPIPALPALVIAGFIFLSWFGLGRHVTRLLPVSFDDATSAGLLIAIFAAVGAGVWSLVWCIAGFFGGYVPATAIACTALGTLMLVVPDRKHKIGSFGSWRDLRSGEWALIALVGVPVLLAAIGALAPPTAKDTLLYHFAVPKAFLAQHSSTPIDGNIASYFPLAAEMHIVWAMLLGRVFTAAAAETGAGLTVWLFFPLLVMAVYGWARELGLTRSWSLIIAAMVATVPTAFHVASSGYVDVALALYTTLAIYALTKWWKSGEIGWTLLIAIFLGAGFSIKLTMIFVIAAFALVILLKARNSENAGTVVTAGVAALIVGGAIASPWYLRTWVTTGSPVFPFYMSIWPGKANGWDVERSNLFQAMNSQYGGVDTNKLNLVTAPVRVSIAAQPEQPANYDGVLGVAFLIGLPVLIWAIWKYDPPVDVTIGSGVAVIVYLFWLFSSEQLRYLLPVLPVLAICIVVAGRTIADDRPALGWVLRSSFIAASVAGLLTGFAWFCERAPLRAAFGGETRDDFLARNLDYYPYYQEVDTKLSSEARLWLINMRRDTYNIDHTVVSDYLFEDWTLRQMLWEATSTDDLRTKAAAMKVQYVLARHDFLFDYDRSTLVDDKKSRSDNETKLRIAKAFLLDPTRTVKSDEKFSLVKIY